MTRARRYHAAKWDEPIVLDLGTPGERGYIPPTVEADLKQEAGDVLSTIPTFLPVACSSLTFAAFWAGSTSASTLSMPSASAAASR